MDARDLRWVFLSAALSLPVTGLYAVWVTDRTAPTCPCCQRAGQPVPIVYGRPTAEVCESAKAGRCELGGRARPADRPAWHCRACGADWGKADDPTVAAWWRPKGL